MEASQAPNTPLTQIILERLEDAATEYQSARVAFELAKLECDLAEQQFRAQRDFYEGFAQLERLFVQAGN